MTCEELRVTLIEKMRKLGRAFSENCDTVEQQQAVEVLFLDLTKVKTLGDAISLLFEYFDTPRPAFGELLGPFLEDLSVEHLTNSEGFEIAKGPRVMFREVPPHA